MKEGRIVEARVTRMEHYGLYLTKGGDTILVLIPEIRWSRGLGHPANFTEIGDQHPVKILRYVEQYEHYIGSLKQVYPEANPLKDAGDGRFAPGRIFEGRVCQLVDYGCFVELSPGVAGLLHISSWEGRSFTVDDEVTVRIVSSSLEDSFCRIHLRLSAL